jgi:hypothetical protein
MDSCFSPPKKALTDTHYAYKIQIFEKSVYWHENLNFQKFEFYCHDGTRLELFRHEEHEFDIIFKFKFLNFKFSCQYTVFWTKIFVERFWKK